MLQQEQVLLTVPVDQPSENGHPPPTNDNLFRPEISESSGINETDVSDADAFHMVPVVNVEWSGAVPCPHIHHDNFTPSTTATASTTDSTCNILPGLLNPVEGDDGQEETPSSSENSEPSLL